MGRKARLIPKYLGEKLTRIRSALALSQNEILVEIGMEEILTRSRISEYEAGFEPPLIVLLHYARLANISVDVLIDDDLDLPPQIPSPARHEGLPRKKPKSTRSPKA